MTSTHPEFDEEERVLGAFLIKLFEAALLLWELVVNLPDVHSLQQGVTVRGVGLSNVDKQVFAVLQGGVRTDSMLSLKKLHVTITTVYGRKPRSRRLTHSVWVSLDLHEGRVLQHPQLRRGDGPVLPHGHSSGSRCSRRSQGFVTWEGRKQNCSRTRSRGSGG